MAEARKIYIEHGYTGLKQSAGLIFDDPLPKLRTLRDRVRVYTEMKQDATVGAVLFAINQFVKSAEWTIDTGDSEQDAEFLKANMNGLSHTWRDFVSEALSMLVYGFSVAEICYKNVNGKIMWKKLPFRSQDSVEKWLFDDDGGIRGFVQTPSYSSDKDILPIPIEKALLFRTSIAKGNPEGESVFRHAFRAYYTKKQIEIIEAIGIERNINGYPVLYVPDDLFMDDEQAKKQLAMATEIINRVRKDENMGVVLPSSWKDAGGLVLLSSEGSQTMDTERVIQRYDARLAMAVLADIILMGHENAGSYALADVKKNLLVLAMGTWLDMIRDVLNDYATPRLFELNGINKPKEALPKFEHGPIANVDPKTLADIVFRLSGVDAFRADPQSRMFFRKILGLPKADSDELEPSKLEIEAKTKESLGRQLAGRKDNELRPPAV
jgi:hypothetical protein